MTAKSGALRKNSSAFMENQSIVDSDYLQTNATINVGETKNSKNTRKSIKLIPADDAYEPKQVNSVVLPVIGKQASSSIKGQYGGEAGAGA